MRAVCEISRFNTTWQFNCHLLLAVRDSLLPLSGGSPFVENRACCTRGTASDKSNASMLWGFS